MDKKEAGIVKAFIDLAVQQLRPTILESQILIPVLGKLRAQAEAVEQGTMTCEFRPATPEGVATGNENVAVGSEALKS